AEARGRARRRGRRRHRPGVDRAHRARDAGPGAPAAGDGVRAHLNAECGVRNEELQGKVVRGTTQKLRFRIPNSTLRITFSPCATSISTSPSAPGAAPIA